jgi:hypothetical protein
MKFKIYDLVYDFEWPLLFLHLLFFVLLLWVFTTFIVDIYAYQGLLVYSLNIPKVMFSILFIIAAFALLRGNEMPSFFYLNLIIALIVTPSLVLFSGSNLPFSFAFTTWTAFAIVAFVAQISRLHTIRTKHINSKILSCCLVILSLLFIASIFALGGGKFINFDFSRVYELRRDVTENLPHIYGYLMPIVSKVIVPVGIVLSLIYRQRMLLLILILCEVMIFALSTHKTPLFIPFVIIGAYWLSKYPQKVNITMLFLIVGVAISGLVYYLLPSGINETWRWIGSIVVYRILLLPSLLNWHHLEFFSTHPYYYWADSKFSLGLITSPYDLPMPFKVSMEYVGIDRMGSANVGWIGSGMGNAGYFGIVLYSVLMGLFLSLIDAYAQKINKSVVFAIFLIPVLTAVQSSDLTGMLLTQGLLVLFLIVIFLDPNVKQRIFHGKGNRI